MKRVSRIKKMVATLGVAATLAVTAGMGLDAATSHNTSQAQAVTYTQWKFVANCMPYPSAWLKWADYNWWEEMWGSRDGWVFSHYVYRYC